jgi:hypothetical protein
MADEVVPGAVSDEAARGKAVGDLGREVERLTHTAGELQRLLELAIVDRDRYAGDARAAAAELETLRAERDALIEVCVGREPELDERWYVDCGVHFDWYDSRAEAVAALFKAAGLGAKEVGTRCGSETS